MHSTCSMLTEGGPALFPGAGSSPRIVDVLAPGEVGAVDDLDV
jgi:hypothetical protein